MLVELVESLSEPQRTGVAALELPVGPGTRLSETFASRIDELDHSARRALLVLAAYDGDGLAPSRSASRSVSERKRRRGMIGGP